MPRPEPDGRKGLPARKKRKSAKVTKKKCRFCLNPDIDISYRNEKIMSRYVSDRGKIVARRVSGNCARHQRQVAREVKVARFLALVPYLKEHFR
jgi:small subunit ribosomal protein S18